MVLIGIVLVFQGANRLIEAIRGERIDLLFAFSMVWLVLIIALAILAPFLPLGEHNDVAKSLMNETNVPPRLLSENPLGTNNQGLDLLSRAIHGARTSLPISLLAVATGTVVGGATELGRAAGGERG